MTKINYIDEKRIIEIQEKPDSKSAMH